MELIHETQHWIRNDLIKKNGEIQEAHTKTHFCAIHSGVSDYSPAAREETFSQMTFHCLPAKHRRQMKENKKISEAGLDLQILKVLRQNKAPPTAGSLDFLESSCDKKTTLLPRDPKNDCFLTSAPSLHFDCRPD